MNRVVADTNVLASGFVRRHPAAFPVQILDAWRERAFILAISDYLLVELERTLNRPYFATRLNPRQIAAILTLLRTEAMLVGITEPTQRVATHREDDLILATAVAAQADYLVTGDAKLQHIGAYQGVSILSPRDFVELL